MTRAHAHVMRSITRAAAKPPLTRPVRGAGVRPSAGGEESARAGGNLHCPMMRGVLPSEIYCGEIESRGRACKHRRPFFYFSGFL